MSPARLLKIGISCYPTFGGSGVVATEIGMALARRGHQVHFLCYEVPRRLNRFSPNIYFHEVVVRDFPLFTFPPYSLALASKMVDVMNTEGLDILHAHYAIPHATSAYLARQIAGTTSTKIITTLHGTDITLVGGDRSYLPITRFSIMESDGITCPSHYLKHATYDKLNIPTTVPIEVIPNFVDVERFAPAESGDKAALRERFSVCKVGGRLLAHASNFRSPKRVGDVVRIFSKVQESVNASLLLIGDGPDRTQVEGLVAELGLRHKVCFLGKQEHVHEIIPGTDLFLMPSENESFGLAALEAMSCGVPVVTTNAEGIPEVVKDGETGFLSGIGEIDKMAADSVRLLTDDALYKRMSAAAREAAVTTFEESAAVEKYERYYEKVLSA